MSYFINNQQKLNDVIFANRNKSYGAYAIRSSYGNTLFKSLAFVILGFGSCAAYAYYLSNQNKPKSDLNSLLIEQDSVYVVKFKTNPDEPEVIPEKEKKVETIEKSTNKTESNSVTVSDTVKHETIQLVSTPTIVPPVTTELTNTLSGIGTDNNASSKSGGSGGGSTMGTGVNSIKTIVDIDQEPEFEGGLKALHQFIASRIRYPQQAAEIGQEGVVFVKFVVDETGKVGNLSLLNSAGFGMDDEALRVIAMIPKFKSPAKIKGQAVKVFYQLPIRFRMK